jgi:hypothetical protein
MARKKWKDPAPPKTVFGTASAGIKAAIGTLAQKSVGRFLLDPIPSADVVRMAVRPGDMEVLKKAKVLRHLQNRENFPFMLKVADEKGDWATHGRLRLTINNADPAAVMPPDYCSPTVWEPTLGEAFPKGNIQPEASFEAVTAMEHGMKDLIEIAHDWALVGTLFDYLDSKPECYKKSNIRFMWAGIMPLLRSGGESCRTAAMALTKVTESGFCDTPPEIYKALRHTNEVIARGLLLADGGAFNRPVASMGYADVKVMCSEMWHPCWPISKIVPRIV